MQLVWQCGMKEERNTYKGEKRFKSLSKIEVDVIIHQELDDKSGLNFYVCLLYFYHVISAYWATSYRRKYLLEKG